MAEKTENKTADKRLLGAVWVCRLLVGAVFIVSGLTKLIDLWGTVFKIEDYLDVWGIDVPRTVVMMGSMALASFEFIAGLLLTVGCYRGVVTWLLLACMLFMLPLTAYIWISDPVSDCGCFGDFIVLSNAATFWKNVVLMAMILFLVCKNRLAKNLFSTPIQWIVVTFAIMYCIAVALVGYNIQPIVDFRPYPVGGELVKSDAQGTGDDVEFVYSKEGKEAVFKSDELPDEEDGWEFVSREEPESVDEEHLSVFDPYTGDDVTANYLADADSLLLLVIPEPARADLSYTYTINELSDAVMSRGGDVVALLATGEKGIDRWKDNSMASYECLSADDTQLKQLARGVMSMVWVKNDTIRWKRTVSSIKLDEVEQIAARGASMDLLEFNGKATFVKFSVTLLSALVLLYLLQTALIGLYAKLIKSARK